MGAYAASYIKPNDRLTSFERLEIYNRQYWFRVLGSMVEDFPGLRAVLGERMTASSALRLVLGVIGAAFIVAGAVLAARGHAR